MQMASSHAAAGGCLLRLLSLQNVYPGAIGGGSAGERDSDATTAEGNLRICDTHAYDSSSDKHEDRQPPSTPPGGVSVPDNCCLETSKTMNECK